MRNLLSPNPKNTWVIELHPNLDLLDYTYSKNWITNTDLIANPDYYFYRRGFKFLSLPQLHREKLKGTRKKDLRHAKQIWDHLFGKDDEKMKHINKVSLKLHYLKKRWSIKGFNALRALTQYVWIYPLLSSIRIKYVLKRSPLKKKIAFVTPNFYPYKFSGWIVEQTALLTKEFQKKWYETTIYTYKHDVQRKTVEKSERWSLIRYTSSWDLFIRLLKNWSSFDLIISNTVFRNSLIVSIIKTLFVVPTKTIICLHSGWKNDEVIRLKKKLRNSFVQKLYFWFLYNNDYIKCLNKDNYEHLIPYRTKKSAAHLLTFYNWIPLKKKEQIKKSKKNIIFTVLFLWTISEKKGVYSLITAIKECSFPCKLLIWWTWDSENLTKLSKNIKNTRNIEYHWYVQWAEKKSLFRDADCLILPSESEWFPMVLLEAASYGLSIVTTKVWDVEKIFWSKIKYISQEDKVNELKENITFLQSFGGWNIIDYSNILNELSISNVSNKYLSLI